MNHIFLSIHHIYKNQALFQSIYLSMHFRSTFSTLHFYFLFIPFQLCNGTIFRPLLFLLSMLLSNPSFLRFSLHYTIHASKSATKTHHLFPNHKDDIVYCHYNIAPTHRIWSYFDAMPNHFPFHFSFSLSLHKRTNELQTCHAAFT